MLITELIEKKRDGFEHSSNELNFIINELVQGRIPDYQMTAWMMAVCCRGMTKAETSLLTIAMMNSGSVVNLDDIPGIKVDKHSTGGVGDTTTLIAAPIVAACGGTVAKMSGRALAHSGGTIDKLESVPGVCVERSLYDFKRIIRKSGLCVIGQSANLVPADRIMYALRDVSGTVKSIPLIASSIMSKKLASGADAIVLDVKMGDGAFMNNLDEARQLAEMMVDIGSTLERRTLAVITDMNRPLGRAVGNGLELKEAIDALTGKLPYDDPLMKVSFTLAEHMLMLSNVADSSEAAQTLIKNSIESRFAYSKLKSMLIELGGDESHIDNPDSIIKVKKRIPVFSTKEGYIDKIDAKKIGTAALMLGAGRMKTGDRIDPAAGILMNKRFGDFVKVHEPIAYLFVNDSTNLKDAYRNCILAVSITDEEPEPLPLIYDVIT